METKIFFTSDTHFDHTNIIKYCNRPFQDTDEMNREMVTRWNKTVQPLDTVYHLGDFALTSTERCKHFLTLLNGKIILIRGNHDKKLQHMKDVIGFKEVYEKMEVDLGKYGKWLVQHHPIKTHKKLLCGHIHDRWTRLGWTINVGVDVWDFTPRTIEELVTTPSNPPTEACKHCHKQVPIFDDSRSTRDHWEGLCV